MTDFLAEWYLWTKSLHIIAVTAWMAGLFYLPRLFVYHAEQVEKGSGSEVMFRTMERRLLRAIMEPAAAATWVFGLALVFTPGIVDWGQVWPWTKALSVIGMTGFHGWLSARTREFAAGTNVVSERTYRIMNEVPTVLLIVIVFSVVVKF
jgi:putative membrane protein